MIRRPRNVSSNSLSLTWSNGFSRFWNRRMGRSQEVIDSEVLRYAEPLTPRRDGNLIRSGIRYTILGSGKVVYKTPYARRLYFNPQYRFRGRPDRGAYWFERVKKRYKKVILKTAREVFNR